MYIANPTITISPTNLDCNGTAAVTVGFEAASAFYANPAEIVLLLDRSAGITPAEMDAVKIAAKQFISNIAIATNVPEPIYIGSQSTLWIAGYADTTEPNQPLLHDVADLEAAVDAIQISTSTANYKTAFETAEQLFLRQTDQRHIVVLFSHSAETALADADPVVEQMKARGVEFFCIGLLDDPAKLNTWASELDRNHVSYTNSAAGLDQAFREIAAEVVLAGVLDGTLTETVGPDFRIIGYDTPSDGTVQLTGQRTITWNIPEAAIPQSPVKPSLTFRVQHVGTAGGVKEVNQPAVYRDRYGNTLDFPAVQAEVTCSGGGGADWYPEPCPEPTVFIVPGCQDAARTVLGDVVLQGLGRIVQLDAILKAVCPGKQVAVSVILTENAPDGTEKPRGVKHILVPPQTGTDCRDLTLKCIQFSLPETLDADDSAGSICNERSFHARVIANYVDTDFVCCEAVSQTP